MNPEPHATGTPHATTPERKTAAALGVSHTTIGDDLGGKKLPLEPVEAVQNTGSTDTSGKNLPPEWFEATDPSRYVTRSAHIGELHLERFDTSNHRKVKP